MSSKGELSGYGSAEGQHGEEPRPLTSVLTRQQHIAETAKKYAGEAPSTLAHHMDMLWMREAYGRLNRKSVPGVDHESVVKYGENLEENLRSLLERAKSGSYRAPAVKRSYIPKDEKEKRAIGIPTTENKVLECAVVMLLEPIYETSFDDGSYGFRTGRSAHQALVRVREQIKEMNGCWVIDVDIRKYFDTIPHDLLMKIIRQRVKDGVVLRLIGKWLKAGTLEEGRISYTEEGTPQGGVVSPMLSNIYLHEVLDQWFQEEIVPQLAGKAKLVRYADDFVLLMEKREEAERMLGLLPQRFEQYGLTVHPEKTSLVDFRHPWVSGHKPGTLDFLGFTHYWGQTRKKGYAIKKKTAAKKLRRSLKGIQQWCKRNSHRPLRCQQQKLSQKILGHYAYYGVRGNIDSMAKFLYQVKVHWHYWLNRRSRKGDGMTWPRFNKLLEDILRLPLPRVIHNEPIGKQRCFDF